MAIDASARQTSSIAVFGDHVQESIDCLTETPVIWTIMVVAPHVDDLAVEDPGNVRQDRAAPPRT